MANPGRRKIQSKVKAQALPKPSAETWICLFLTLVLALWGIVSRADDLSDSQITDIQNSCERSLDNSFKKLYDDSQGGAAWDPKTKCTTNVPQVDEATNTAKVALIDQKAAEAQNTEIENARKDVTKLIQGSDTPKQPAQIPTSACMRTYAGISWAMIVVKKERALICQQTTTDLTSVKQCYQGGSIQNCDDQRSKMASEVDKEAKKTDLLLSAISRYVSKLAPANKKASEDYRSDLNTLSHLNGPGVDIQAIDTDADAHPENGAAATPREYFQALAVPNSGVSVESMYGRSLDRNGKANTMGPLIQEEAGAEEVAGKFQQTLNSYRDDDSNFRQKMKTSVLNYTPPSTGSDWGGKAAAVAPYAAAGASGLSGLTSAAGGAAAVAGVAAAAGSSALSSTSGTNLGSASGSGNSSAPASTSAASTNLGGSNGPVTVAAGPAPVSVGQATDTASAAKATPSSAPAAVASFDPRNSSSSSSSPEASASGSHGVSSQAQAHALSDDLMHTFTPNLNPSPSAKKKDDSADMNNILGQMKNLFNFPDSNKPAEEAAVDPTGPFGGPANANAAPNAPAAAEFNDGFTYGSHPYENAATGNGAESGEDRTLASSDPEVRQFGSRSEPLFDRVRQRHHIAMEKGLVILQVGGLPK